MTDRKKVFFVFDQKRRSFFQKRNKPRNSRIFHGQKDGGVPNICYRCQEKQEVSGASVMQHSKSVKRGFLRDSTHFRHSWTVEKIENRNYWISMWAIESPP